MDSNTTPEKEIFQKIRKIDIRTRRMVTDVMSGEYQSAFRGRGVEFDQVREYQEGDDQRSIDWNITARMGHPYVKSYIEERELSLTFLVDVSASVQFGTHYKLKKETIAEFCAALTFSAMKNKDRFSLVLFSDVIELYIPPKKGKTHLLRIMRELLYFKPKSKKTNISKSMEFLHSIVKKKSIVFFVSDFYQTPDPKLLRITNSRHDLVAIEAIDPGELEIPKLGLVYFQDLETQKQILVDTSNQVWRKQFVQKQFEMRFRNKEMFKKLGIDHFPIYTNRPFERDLVLFFKKRTNKHFGKNK